MDNLEKLEEIIPELKSARKKIHDLPLPDERDAKYDDALAMCSAQIDRP